MHPEAEQRATAKPQHASAWKAAAPDGELVFANVARLKKAMKAARTVLRTHEPSARADAACRVISRKGQHTAEIMATDGHRLCVVDVTPIRESSIEQEFDVAMPLEAVRTIANARQTTMVRIGRNGDGCVVAFGREDNRIIEQEPPYAAVAEMPRTEALKTLHASAPTGDEYNPDGICRFEIAQDGLRVWPTTHEPAVEETEPGRKVADRVARFGKRMVFGMRHRHVVETLRTMTGSTVWMVIEDPRKPIHMGATSGGERYVISAFALSNPRPNGNGKHETTSASDDGKTKVEPHTVDADETQRWKECSTRRSSRIRRHRETQARDDGGPPNPANAGAPLQRRTGVPAGGDRGRTERDAVRR